MQRSVRELVLYALARLPPGEAMGRSEVAQQVTSLSGTAKAPTENELLGRLTTLRQDGAIERAGRGQYRIPAYTRPLTELEAEVGKLLTRRLQPDELHRVVVWDATPYLDLAEDGAPGPRLVIEHPQVTEAFIPSDGSLSNRYKVWRVKGRSPVASYLMAPPAERLPAGQAGLVIVDRERPGGTGLTPQGFRVAFPERVLADFLGLEAADRRLSRAIMDALLLVPDQAPDFERLWKSAHGLGALTDLVALLAAAYPKLPQPLRGEFRSRMVPVVQEMLGA